MFYMVVSNVAIFCISSQTALDSGDSENGAWVGKGRTSGSTYDNWEFYDGTKLNQCYDKECSSGEGKFIMSNFR